MSARLTTIVWDTNGGTPSSIANSSCTNPQTATNPNGDAYSLFMPAAPARSGYAFIGWHSWGSPYYNVPQLVSASDIVPGQDVGELTVTLHAHWASLVTLVPNGGTVESELISVESSANYGGAKTYGSALPLPARIGYRFDGWWTGLGVTYPSVPVDAGTACIEQAHTLYAHWSLAVVVTVTFVWNGGTSSSPATAEFTLPAFYGTLPAVARDGYAFAGWWTAPSGGTRVLADYPIPSADHALYARWTAAGSGSADDVFVSADGWVDVTLAKVVASFPAAVLEVYNSWLTQELREARLGILLEGVIDDYRTATGASRHPVGELSEVSVPVACLRPLLNTVWYSLAVEMGMPQASALEYRTAWLDAGVFLRGLFIELRTGTSRYLAEAGCAAPTYARPAAASSGGGSASGGRTGVINLGLPLGL